MEKTWIDRDNTVTFSCRQCKKTRVIDASRFSGHKRAKIRCPCGSISKIQLEYRRQYRKETDLPGLYKVIPADNTPPESGRMKVVDISRNGVRLRFQTPVFLTPGDRLHIQFHLDDKTATFVERDVIVQNIDPPHVGAKFQRPHEMDNVIGFYLFR